MGGILGTVAKAAGKALISLLMELATDAFFKEILLMLAEKAAKSSKTDIDDKAVEIIKKALNKKASDEEA